MCFWLSLSLPLFFLGAPARQGMVQFKQCARCLNMLVVCGPVMRYSSEEVMKTIDTHRKKRKGIGNCEVLCPSFPPFFFFLHFTLLTQQQQRQQRQQ
ncbi:hypothetical protein BKA57DRAFT_445652 [Linnemannia elongata]|nr:hypothetical protein BKA57DRAFT_445652 [Linnemannia elongata]